MFSIKILLRDGERYTMLKLIKVWVAILIADLGIQVLHNDGGVKVPKKI